MYKSLPSGFILSSTFKITVGGGLFWLGYEFFSGNERFHREQVMPLIHRLLDPELAHKLAVKTTKYGLSSYFPQNRREYPELKCSALGRDLKNPIGLAAGFDKNGEALGGLLKLGFGFIEIGSITPYPQPGNDKPRLFLLENDDAIVNSYGFNNDGHEAVSRRIMKALYENRKTVFGVNLGKNKTSSDEVKDFSLGVETFANIADYIVINVSSPNTQGLRSLQSAEKLSKILDGLQLVLNKTTVNRPKLLVKISPDLSIGDMEGIAKISMNEKYNIYGLIVTNTTTSRPSTLQSSNIPSDGGLSGPPLRELSTKCVHKMYRLTKGQVPIIGCGGIESGADAYDKIKAGASLVQIYTSIVYQGFPVVGRIKRELVDLLKTDGFSNISEAIGFDHRKNQTRTQNS